MDILQWNHHFSYQNLSGYWNIILRTTEIEPSFLKIQISGMVFFFVPSATLLWCVIMPRQRYFKIFYSSHRKGCVELSLFQPLPWRFTLFWTFQLALKVMSRPQRQCPVRNANEIVILDPYKYIYSESILKNEQK